MTEGGQGPFWPPSFPPPCWRSRTESSPEKTSAGPSITAPTRRRSLEAATCWWGRVHGQHPAPSSVLSQNAKFEGAAIGAVLRIGGYPPASATWTSGVPFACIDRSRSQSRSSEGRSKSKSPLASFTLHRWRQSGPARRGSCTPHFLDLLGPAMLERLERTVETESARPRQIGSETRWPTG